MIINKIKINNIPAVLWGEESLKKIIAVHGNQSSKMDECIKIFAEKAVILGYQLISFDLPKHGERINENKLCKVQECVSELREVMEYVKQEAEEISVFGCSMGAYFSLLAYKENSIKQALFLSPVTNMEHIIHNIMEQFEITEERLRKEKVIKTPIETLDWEYYCYVKDHPIKKWDQPTSILRGEYDTLCEETIISDFAEKYHCDLEILKGGEHWFHTKEQLKYFGKWVERKLILSK